MLKQSEEKACKGKEDTPVNKVNQLINPVLRSVSVAEFGLFNHQSNGLIFLRQLQRMLERE